MSCAFFLPGNVILVQSAEKNSGRYSIVGGSSTFSQPNPISLNLDCKNIMGSNHTVTFISKSSQIAKDRNENVNVLLDHLRSNPNHVIYETLLSIQSSSHKQLNALFFAIRFITGVTFVGEKRSNWRGNQLPFCDFRTGQIFHFGDP